MPPVIIPIQSSWRNRQNLIVRFVVMNNMFLEIIISLIMWDRSHHDISRITGNHEQTDLTSLKNIIHLKGWSLKSHPVCTYIIKVDELPVVPLPIQISLWWSFISIWSLIPAGKALVMISFLRFLNYFYKVGRKSSHCKSQYTLQADNHSPVPASLHFHKNPLIPLELSACDPDFCSLS